MMTLRNKIKVALFGIPTLLLISACEKSPASVCENPSDYLNSVLEKVVLLEGDVTHEFTGLARGEFLRQGGVEGLRRLLLNHSVLSSLEWGNVELKTERAEPLRHSTHEVVTALAANPLKKAFRRMRSEQTETLSFDLFSTEGEGESDRRLLSGQLVRRAWTDYPTHNEQLFQGLKPQVGCEYQISQFRLF